jgi:rhodanese-related sulfurtransferase
VVAIFGFIVYRIVHYHRDKVTGVIPRIEVEELAKRMLIAEHEIVLVDVRSHGYYDSGAARIAGSIRIEPNQLSEELKTLPRDKDIYVYCT